MIDSKVNLGQLERAERINGKIVMSYKVEEEEHQKSNGNNTKVVAYTTSSTEAENQGTWYTAKGQGRGEVNVSNRARRKSCHME